MADDKPTGQFMWNDRRTHRRTPIVKLVQLQHPGGPQLAETVDLSPGGMGVRVTDPPPSGSQVNIALELEDGGRVDALAMTVRVGPVVGLKFIGLSPEEYLNLNIFLTRHHQRKS
jgi:hypothetical protein